MAYVADYDPSSFDAADPLTWPQPAPYSPGEWWYITAPGTIDGVAVDVGDRVYPLGTGRLYGEDNYGDGTFGGAVPAPPWPANADRVRWVAVTSSAPAWDRPSPPYAGCPFVLDGWRIVVELLYVEDEATQLYGSGTYGSGTYGSADGLGDSWVDVTPAAFGLLITRGADSGRPFVDVDELRADLLDVDAAIFPLLTVSNTADGIARRPTVATPIRVAVIDPLGEFVPLFAGRIEQLRDTHDDDGVRTIAVDAFGFASDLATVDVDVLQRPAESVVERLTYLLDVADWAWGIGDLPDPFGPELRRIDAVPQANVREEIDRAAISASWYVLTDRQGRLTAVEWPLVPDTSDVLDVTDRVGVAALPSPSIEYVADAAELLNIASGSSEAVQGAPEIVRTSTDADSVGQFGRRSEALDFPLSGLSAPADDLEALVTAARDRFARVVVRSESLEADTSLDVRWLEQLARTDIGRAVRTTRSKPVALVLDHVVVGIEHRLTRDRWTSTLRLSTTTPTI